MSIDAKKSAAYQQGLMAEDLAAEYLKDKGYEILEHRYKTKAGEIDLIAWHDGYLIAVEVKQRRALADALEAVTARSRKRIQNALLYYLQANPQLIDCGIRFDVIAVIPPLSIHHLDNAWQAQA